MRRRTLILAELLLVGWLGPATVHGQRTWYVDDDNCPGPGSGTPEDPFCRIQDGIIAASTGDTVLVLPGTYNEAIDFIGKAITVWSSDGPEVTTIDASGLGNNVVRCIDGERSTTVLEGFTIKGGGNAPGGLGGGMYNRETSPRVVNCVFTGNRAGVGAGMFNDRFSTPTVIDCTFTANIARNGGGGMANGDHSNPTVMNCEFTRNLVGSGQNGGGMFNDNSSNATVINCAFNDNSAGGNGGGMYNNRSSPTVTDCTFKGNMDTGLYNHGNSNPCVTNCTFTQNSGGGMRNIDSNPTVTNCKFIGNRSDTEGGGMYNVRGSSPTLVNCLFSGNDAPGGGGMKVSEDSNPTVTNCTFSGNTAGTGGGILMDKNTSLMLTNCILWGNSDSGGMDESAQIDVNGGMLDVNYSCIQGLTGELGGVGNIGDDPLFVDADLRLLPGSPCINAGNADALPPDECDLDGDGNTVEPTPLDLDGLPREVCAVDMGAYESGFGDSDADQDVDLNDFEAYLGCVTGPANGDLPPGCEPFDFDCDFDVDWLDFGGFQVVYTGAP